VDHENTIKEAEMQRIRKTSILLAFLTTAIAKISYRIEDISLQIIPEL
jgi:hypothetical protein